MPFFAVVNDSFCQKFQNTFLGNKNHNILRWSSKVDFIWQLCYRGSVQTPKNNAKQMTQMYIVKRKS